ncbi:single-stranded-DNA-specific exonuclease RecJ, partial [candidate division WWE3 bacterium CG_4_8_14_3_um_filter_42_11]
MIAKKWIIKPRKKEDLIEQILYNRGFRTREMIDEFLNPSLSNLPDIFSFKNMRLAVERLKKAQQNHETIIVFGDYDVDGETAAAIVWETLYKLGFAVLPYLPSREEGYGLNIQAIEKFKNEGVSLIITVDCGISSVAEIKLAKKLGIDTIVTDHHQPGNQLPEALAIVHSDELAGVGVAWFLSQAILQEFKKRSQVKDFLDLVALGTIADLSPLLGSNRILVKYGIDVLRKTERIGLKILIREAGLDLGEIDTYEIGFILAPRLNAMGRIHHAISSLRLLCTRDFRQAVELSKKLNLKNAERQDLTAGSYEQARRMVLGKVDFPKALIIASQEWHEGIIGLVAGRLVEEFYRPAIVLSLGEKVSKGSVRSIPGFNIIQSLREFEEYFIDLGGHPAAA